MKNGAREGEAALKHDERHAIVALAADPSRTAAMPERRWLARARLHRRNRREDFLPRILDALSLPPPDGGLAACRFRDWSGEPPQGWVAAADPVYLETRANHLRLRAFPASELPADEVRDIFELLQERLGETQPRTFTAAGATGYLRLATPIATAAVSPAVADGASPEWFLPQGPAAAGHDRWHSEVQMCLYDASVNQRRMRSGRLPINGLWFWGGGEAPPPARRTLPVLFGADPVVRGYWHGSLARAEAWPGNFSACADGAGGGFVAVVPGTPEPASALAELRRLLARGRIRRLSLLFPGGLSAELRRSDRLRFWRRPADGPAEGGEP
ncbi:MAG TPA: hypothetical protein VFG91_06255 [Woeseiaceae bacterium]|nr:hypothetical protein [Woeseiaceae bacterium]